METALDETPRHRLPDEHVYEGIHLPGMVTPKALDQVKQFHFSQGDIVIFGYPKTGTTWLAEMTWLLLNKGDMATAREKDIIERFHGLEFPEPNGQYFVENPTSQSQRLFKSHLDASFFQTQLEQDPMKMIVIIRNPKDVFVSYYHFYKAHEFLGCFSGTWEEFFRMIISGTLALGDYFVWYSRWLQYWNHPKVCFVKFEDMKRDLHGELVKISRFLQSDINEEQLKNVARYGEFEVMKTELANCALRNQHAKYSDSTFMRSGKVGGWREWFTPEQSSFVDERYDQYLKQFDIDLQYDP